MTLALAIPENYATSVDRERRRHETDLYLYLLAGLARAARHAVSAGRHGLDPARAAQDAILGNDALELRGIAPGMTVILERAYDAGWRRAHLTAAAGHQTLALTYDPNEPRDTDGRWTAGASGDEDLIKEAAALAAKEIHAISETAKKIRREATKAYNEERRSLRASDSGKALLEYAKSSGTAQQLNKLVATFGKDEVTADIGPEDADAIIDRTAAKRAADRLIASVPKDQRGWWHGAEGPIADDLAYDGRVKTETIRTFLNDVWPEVHDTALEQVVDPHGTGEPNPAIEIRRSELLRKIRRAAKASSSTLALTRDESFLPGLDQLALQARNYAASVAGTIASGIRDALAGAVGGVKATVAAVRAWFRRSGYVVSEHRDAAKPSKTHAAAVAHALSAYNRGSDAGYMAIPVVTGFVYVAVLDNATTHYCRPLNGVRMPKDSPWVEAHKPPRHFGCRSLLRPIIGDFEPTADPPWVPPMAGFPL